ncbi:MAG: hypothetical protein U1G07_03915 [Verrucomicrobiota bacterium]
MTVNGHPDAGLPNRLISDQSGSGDISVEVLKTAREAAHQQSNAISDLLPHDAQMADGHKLDVYA